MRAFAKHRLYYDITELVMHDKGTGIQRVTKSLLKELKAMCPSSWEIVPVKGDPASGCYRSCRIADSQKPSPACVYREEEIKPVAGDIFLSVDLTYNITRTLADKLREYREQNVVVSFIVYDLIPVRHPEWFEGCNQWFEGNDYLALFYNWLDCVVKNASSLVCISEYVAHDVTSWLEAQPHPAADAPIITHFRLGCNCEVEPKGTIAPTEGWRNSRTFLMVGTIEPRKGHALALDAFEDLWSEGHDVRLVVIGRAGWLVDDLIQRFETHPERNRRFKWLPEADDYALNEHYDAACCLLGLSVSEGFGLPLIEAASRGVPLIVRDIPVFREVCGEGAYFTSCASASDLTWEIKRFLAEDWTVHVKKVAKVPVITWRRSAELLLHGLKQTGANLPEWKF